MGTKFDIFIMQTRKSTDTRLPVLGGDIVSSPHLQINRQQRRMPVVCNKDAIVITISNASTRHVPNSLKSRLL